MVGSESAQKSYTNKYNNVEQFIVQIELWAAFRIQYKNLYIYMRFALVSRRRDERPCRLYAFLHAYNGMGAAVRQPAAIQVEHDVYLNLSPLEPFIEIK